MLVTNVGDETCCQHGVGDNFEMLVTVLADITKLSPTYAVSNIREHYQ